MKILLIFSIFLSVSSAYAERTAAIEYTFTVKNAAHHLAEVTVKFPHVGNKTLDVKMPVWRSGRYEILDLPSAVREFQATDVTGQLYESQRLDKNTWRIFLKHPGAVKVSYEIYANMLSERVRHIDKTHAFIDASGVFMYSPSQRDVPVQVELQVPDGWQSRSGMEKLGAHTFKAENYDVLVDSPIETGIHDYRKFELDDKVYEIVVWGEGNYEMDKLQADVSALHKAAADIWGDYPFQRYVYMYHIGDGLRGATEHVNSTIIQWDRFGFYPREQYLRVMGTTSHEFVHTWNVKSYRPAGITPYDYNKENYANLLWIAEGTTSYYDGLLAARSGVFSVEEYLKQLAKDIRQHLKKPGRSVMSVQQASFNKWLVESQDRALNSTSSIYLEGSLVSWLLDKEIRRLSADKKSLDDLHRLLYERYAKSKTGYSEKHVKAILKELTEADFEDFWLTYVRGTEAINFDELLAYYGLVFKPKKPLKEGEKPSSWIGVDVQESQGMVVVKHVAQNSPGWEAGLTAGDILIAINGYQLKPEKAKARLMSLDIGQSINIHYINNGVLSETQAVVLQEPLPEFIITTVNKPSTMQRKRFENWMKRDWDEAFNKKDQ